MDDENGPKHTIRNVKSQLARQFIFAILCSRFRRMGQQMQRYPGDEGSFFKKLIDQIKLLFASLLNLIGF